MRARWRFLFWISLAALIGVAWLAQRFGTPLSQLMLHPPPAGMLIGSVLAFVAMVTGSRSRRFAWVVLVCWSPMAFDLLEVVSNLAAFVREEEVPAVLFVLGGLLTPIVALWIALAPPPASPVEPIARAELR